MNLKKKIILALAACLVLTAIPALAETYTCEQQGFSFEYDPAYTAQWEDDTGVVVYLGKPGQRPYIIVTRIGRGEMPSFDADAYLRHNILNMKAQYGDLLLSVEQKMFTIGELELPGLRYIYELDGVVINGQKAQVELITCIHETEDSVRRYTAKYNPGEGDKALDAMAQAIRSFIASEIPVTYKTFTCDEEGFSIEADSSYSVQYDQDESVKIYTESEGVVPYASVWCLTTGDVSGYDVDKLLAGHAEDMSANYGKRLRETDDVEIEIGGEDVKGMGYIYDNDRGYGIERLVFIQKTADALLQFEARSTEGMIDDTLMAMIHAAESFKLLNPPDGKVTEPSDAPVADSSRSTPTDELIGFEMRPITWDGVNIGKVAVPSGYVCLSEIHCCDESTCMGSPVRLSLNLMPENSNGISMSYYAAETYIDRVSSSFSIMRAKEGELDIDSRIFQKRYLNAAQYCDEKASDMNATFWKEEPITFYDDMVDKHYREYSSAVLPDFMTKEWCEVTAAHRVYTYELGGRKWAMCVAAEVRGMQFSITGMSGEVQTAWEVPGGVFTLICPLEDYERIHDGAFAAFMQNTAITDTFVDIQIAISNQIQSSFQGLTNMLGAQSAAYAAAMDSFMSESVNSYLSSSSYDTAARFSDYMFDQNTYTTSDGYDVSISTDYGYVWEGDNGNVYYSQYASDMPYGVTRLSPR